MRIELVDIPEHEIESRAVFQRVFSEGCEINEENVRLLQKLKFNLGYFAHHKLLSEEALQVYRRGFLLAQTESNKVWGPPRQEKYDTVCQGWKDYQSGLITHEDHIAICAEAEKTYEKYLQPASDVYQKVLAPYFVEASKIEDAVNGK